MSLVHACLAALALLSREVPAAAPEQLLGTFRVRAVVHLSGVPLVKSLDLRGDVVVKAGERPGTLAVKLASRGHDCKLVGRAAGAAELTLPPGQACTIVLDDPEARGRVVAEVLSGRGRVDGSGRLRLALEVKLAGRVSVATGLAGVPGLAGEADVPVDGEAQADAEGVRDNSRGAE